jgi:hypothetical protein
MLTSQVAHLGAKFSVNRQFVVNDATKGDYQVSLTDLPHGTYVKSIRFGGADVLNNGLHIDSRSTGQLDIVLSSHGGLLDGTVVDPNRAPVPNATVSLVPDAAHRHRGDLYQGTTSDNSGRFHFEGVSPGNYLLFAWRGIEDGLWRDPDFVRRNEVFGKAVHIGEAGLESTELSVIPFAY